MINITELFTSEVDFKLCCGNCYIKSMLLIVSEKNPPYNHVLDVIGIIILLYSNQSPIVPTILVDLTLCVWQMRSPRTDVIVQQASQELHAILVSSLHR